MQGSLGSNSRQKTGEVMEERGYMCGLYNLLSLLSHATQEPLLRLVLPTEGGPSCSNHSSIKCHTNLPAGQSDGGVVLSWSSPISDDASWDRVEKTNQHKCKCSDLVRIRLAPGAPASLAPKHCLLGILTQDLGMTDSFKAQKISNRAASCLEVTYRQALNLWR